MLHHMLRQCSNCHNVHSLQLCITTKMKATIENIKHFDDTVLKQDLNDTTIQLVHDVLHNKTVSQDKDVNSIASQFKKYYDEQQFTEYTIQAKKLQKLAKQQGMQYGFELQPRIIPVYYKACEAAANECDLDEAFIKKQTRVIGHQKRNLSEAMSSILTLGKYTPYFKSRYEDTLRKIEKDRLMLHHRTMILKMKNRQRKQQSKRK